MCKYKIYIGNEIVLDSLKRLTNQIYKLLPAREEGLDWKKPLETIIEELCGMDRLLIDQQDFFPLICKLEGLFILTEDTDFLLYRRIIFECLNLMNKIKQDVEP